MQSKSFTITKHVSKVVVLIAIVIVINISSVVYTKTKTNYQLSKQTIENDELIIQNFITSFNKNIEQQQQQQSITQSTSSSSSVSLSSSPSVSVIIPVFKVEKYIEKCIASLLTQTLGNDIEFIFVDDLGKDGSMEIVEKYSKFDPRIRIITNTANIGAGASRNVGIAAARGEYLGFVDPDDWVSPTFYERLFTAAKSGDYDVSKGKMVEIMENSNSFRHTNLNDGITNKINKVKSNNLTNNGNDGSSFNVFELFTYQHQTGLFKKSVIEANPGLIRYGESYSGEDITFLLTYGFFARSIVCVDEAWYYYFVRHNSASNDLSYEFLKGDFESMNDRFDFIEKRGMSISDFPKYHKRCVKMAKGRFKQILALDMKNVNSDDFKRLKKYALKTMDRLKSK